MRPVPVLATFCALTLLAFAGCLSDGSAKYQGPTQVPADAPSTIGDGDFPLQVRVIRETNAGAPLPGAPIVIYPIEKPAQAPTLQQLLRMNASLGGRTDENGELTANLDHGATYSFITASEGWTTEARHLVKITDDYRKKPLTITVFANNKTVYAQGSVPTTAKFDMPLIRVGGTISSPPLWFPATVKFHEDPASNRQYVFRLMSTATKLQYTVGATEYADFGLRVGFLQGNEPEPKFYWEVNKVPPLATQGTFDETLAVEASSLAWGDGVKDARFAVGPYTTQGVLAPNGIKWNITIEATFATDPVTVGYRPYMPAYGVPGAALPLILLGLLGAALAWSRQR